MVFCEINLISLTHSNLRIDLWEIIPEVRMYAVDYQVINPKRKGLLTARQGTGS